MTPHQDTTTRADARDAGSDGTPDHVLRIISGIHAGACRKLDAQEMILVGSGDDCDIVLADTGVARHHALINLAPQTCTLRALDAPLRLDGRPVHPGDPVAFAPLQRIELGEAAIAFGADGDAGWEAMLPADGNAAATAKRPPLRRLTLVAALAVSLLAVATVFAVTVPLHTRQVDPQAELAQLRQAFNIEQGRIVADDDGVPTLSGTVKDDATIERIKQRLEADGVVLNLALRSGQKIAEDVKEVLRVSPQPLTPQTTRYLGNGNVEIAGRFEDPKALDAAVHSRAMNDVVGVKQVLVRNYADNLQPDGRDTPAARPQKPAPVRIVSVVRGDNSYVVALDGTHYAAGEDLPGIGRLSVIGDSLQAVSSDGIIHKVHVRPVTLAELAAAADAQVQAERSAQAQTRREAAMDPVSIPRAATPAQPVERPDAGILETRLPVVSEARRAARQAHM